MLADLGATVIKLERPGEGDEVRLAGHQLDPARGDQSAYFARMNAGKRSVAVDFSNPQARELVLDIVRRADVVVENFSPGVMAKYGFDEPSLRKVRPDLVYCSISGFGQTGPYAPRPGYDALIQAMGGVMSLTGEPNGSPQKVGVPVADLFAGLYGCIGILAAVNHRNSTGQGQQIDIGMLDTHVAWLANQGMNYLATGENPPRLGNQHPNIAPYQEFPTKDGYIILAVGNDPTFERFCKAFGQEALLADPRFATNPIRVQNRQLVTDTLTPVMKSKTTAEWIDALEALKIGCGPINTLEQVFADPHVQAREMVVEMAHGSGETVKVIANPVKLSATPPSYRSAPPVLGEHTNAVLSDVLKMSAAEIAALKDKGIL
jgi:crotonobetainyl-CoA:carnitine CoA-transferase CaiB-like acyl-CoA transferase